MDRGGGYTVLDRMFQMVPQLLADTTPEASPDYQSLGLIEYAMAVTPTYQPGAVHYALADALEKAERHEITRLIVTFPPRHGKTELASIKFASWYLGRHPTHAFINCSYGATLANRISRKTRDTVRSPLYPFDNVKLSTVKAAIQQWETNHGGEYNAAGVTGAITGMGADVLLIDDYIKNVEEADSDQRREDIWDWYSDVAYPRLQSDGIVIIIATRWHEDDLIGRLLSRAKANPEADQWHVVEFKAIAEPDEDSPDPLGRSKGEALWPEKYPIAELNKRKAQMSHRMWLAEYQSSPVAAEGNLFKKAWIRFWYPQNMPVPRPYRFKLGAGEEYIAPQKALPPAWDRQAQSWDFAVKETEAGSYTAGQVWKRIGPEAYLIDEYHQRVDFPQQLLALQTTSALHPTVIAKVVESKATGEPVMAMLEGTVPGMIGRNPVGDKYTRADATTPLWEAGNVYLPHPDLFPWVIDYIEELTKFPSFKYNDRVDAMSQGIGYLYDLGEDGGEVVIQRNAPPPEADPDDPWAYLDHGQRR